MKPWLVLFKSYLLVKCYVADIAQSTAELTQVKRIRCVNARAMLVGLSDPLVNGLTGQLALKVAAPALLGIEFWLMAQQSPHALLSYMTDADLNPIRVKRADTPESFGYTSTQKCISPSPNWAQSFAARPAKN
ncbi:MAG: hypothetical protein ACI9WS_001188 [Paraglaciecola psychrophila]|jgi:hypothetical protein